MSQTKILTRIALDHLKVTDEGLRAELLKLVGSDVPGDLDAQLRAVVLGGNGNRHSLICQLATTTQKATSANYHKLFGLMPGVLDAIQASPMAGRVPLLRFMDELHLLEPASSEVRKTLAALGITVVPTTLAGLIIDEAKRQSPAWELYKLLGDHLGVQMADSNVSERVEGLATLLSTTLSPRYTPTIPSIPPL